jgi:hypothetical protein
LAAGHPAANPKSAFHAIENALELSVPIESERKALDSCFDAFSLREPVSTSLKNALVSARVPDPLMGGRIDLE